MPTELNQYNWWDPEVADRFFRNVYPVTTGDRTPIVQKMLPHIHFISMAPMSERPIQHKGGAQVTRININDSAPEGSAVIDIYQQTDAGLITKYSGTCRGKSDEALKLLVETFAEFLKQAGQSLTVIITNSDATKRELMIKVARDNGLTVLDQPAPTTAPAAPTSGSTPPANTPPGGAEQTPPVATLRPK